MTGAPDQIERLITLMARLPGLGPRSARRAVLHLMTRRDRLLTPLALALQDAAESVRPCRRCNNLATDTLCPICLDPNRVSGDLAIVTDVSDLWAMERAGVFQGGYHVLGGNLSALDDVGPDDLGIPALLARIEAEEITEVILALAATVDGQTTAHYLADAIGHNIRISTLAQGVPVGGALDYLDEGTIGAALRARRPY